MDESKVYPKINPLDGSTSYFKNDRINSFNKILKKVCEGYDRANFIDMSRLSDDWVGSCLFKDGLHPNDKGHELIFAALKDYVVI